MSEILRGRKKGRPSKADLARRENSGDGYDLRRSHRRRNVRYNFDYDDYLEEDDEDEEAEEERRRKKKMKLVPVLKLNQSRASADPPTTHRGRPAAGVGHASDDDDEAEAEGEKEEEEDDEDASEKKPVKNRKINGSAEEDRDYEEEEGEEDREDAGIDDDEESKGKETPNISSCPVIQIESSSETPLPDKKSLELILDKLQKKDVYGVYAEPVDPEELPDYHEIIEQPMDFATVRKKLTNGSYSTLEEFESDVFLICSNAMQYNAPDTVYYKQARTIQEMGKKKFQKIRIKIERGEKELKPEQRIKPGSTGTKQVKQSLNQNVLEHVGSDFSSGANLANGGTQTSGYEKHNYTDGLLGSNISLIDSLEKAEDLSSGRGLVGKFGRKLSAVEDNRRKTYDTSHHLSERSESIFSTFDCEIKHLVAVGLHAEYAYARGLARFAATMGPVAWKVASQRIEQALPAGVKFGRGWVGEYEPRPTPMLLLSSSTPKESSAVGTVSEGKPSFVGLGAVKPNAASWKQNPPPRASVEPQREVPRQVELNLPPAEQSNPPCVPEKQRSGKSDTMAFRSIDVTGATNGISPRGLSNGKASTGLNSRMIDLSMVNTSNQMTRASTCSLHTGQGELQNRDDQTRLMRSLSEIHPQVPSDVLSVPFRRSELQPQASASNGFPFQTFIHQTGHGITDESSHRPTGFPQMVSNSDFSRWRGGITPHVQFKQKQDNFPPDLNIGVQSSPDSPAKQSSHQQPDLALQL